MAGCGRDQNSGQPGCGDWSLISSSVSALQPMIAMDWTWFHRLGSPRWFFQFSGRALPWVASGSLVLLTTGVLWGLAFAPTDYQQGDSYRIMYIHVPAAMLAQSIYMMMAAAGAVLLIWRIKLADLALASCAPIGASFAFLALATGAIWGKPTWGTYWVWDARLTSTLMLLFLYLGIIALRGAMEDRNKAGRACALLALVGVVNIPIIKYSVNWWYTLHQAASFTLTDRPAMPFTMWMPLLVMVLGYYALFLLVWLLRMRNGILWRERNSRWVRELLVEGESARQSRQAEYKLP